jgi:uncharacterized protein (DUF58 family)
VHPSRRAVLVVAAATVLAVVPVLIAPALWALWLACWAALVLGLVADRFFTAHPSALELQVATPDVLYVGHPAALEVRLRWTHGWQPAIHAWVRPVLSPTLVAAERQRAEIRRGDRQTVLHFDLRARRRGEAHVERVWLSWRGPLGLLQRTLAVVVDRRVEAVPNISAVRQLALKFAAREHTSGLRIERYLGDGTEFDSLRDFRPGLDRRSIDWKASARHTQLLARHFRAERNRQVIVALDTGHLMAEPLGGIPRVDHAIHAALLLAFVSVRSGDRVGLYAFDEKPGTFAEPRAGMGAFRNMLAVSGGLAYSDAETNFTLGLTALLQRLNRRSLVVVMTDFVDATTAELMVENLQRLAARHLVVFVSLRDPLLERVSAAAPTDLVALQRSVVADSAVREREIVLSRLRRRGVLCLDSDPTHVDTRLLNQYLEIKRRELV